MRNMLNDSSSVYREHTQSVLAYKFFAVEGVVNENIYHASVQLHVIVLQGRVFININYDF